MSACRLVMYVGNHIQAAGFAVARCRCDEHGWDLGEMPVSAQTVCPVGRIEKAVDDGVARIEKAIAEIRK